MSKILTVDLPGRAYDIEIERGLLDRVGERCKAVLPRAKAFFVVTDSTVGPLYGQRVLDSLEKAGFAAVLHTVPAGEESKCVERLQELWEAMMAARLTRTDAVVALGGGVVGDLAGFAAATVLRGVDYIQIPTTLLAQVDSSVGGKVAIDLHAGKNLAGAFWQPKGVLIDPEVLTTLTDRTFSDGMAEVIKYGCIRDRAFFDKLAAWGGREGVMEHIEEVIHTCCDIKRKVVLNDERDTGERMVLNFGHTIGHAFELAGHYETWTHGQGVAAGMCVAARLGEQMGITPAGTTETIQNILKEYQLPLTIPCPWDTLVEAVGLDKKNAGSDIRLIVLEELGKAVPHAMPREALLEALAPMWKGN